VNEITLIVVNDLFSESRTQAVFKILRNAMLKLQNKAKPPTPELLTPKPPNTGATKTKTANPKPIVNNRPLPKPELP